MQFPSRKARVALLAGCATLGLAGTASASTADYNTATDVLTIAIDGAGTDTLTCDGVNVKFNGNPPLRDGAAPLQETGCAASVNLIVNEADKATANANVVDLSDVKRSEWAGIETAKAVPAITLGGGNDTVIGSEFGESITPGDAADTVHGGPGNDTMIWNPGEDSDVMNGDAGVDTVVDNGVPTVDETFVVKPKDTDPTRVDVTRTIPAAGIFTLDIEAENLTVDGKGGNDTIQGSVGVAGLVKTTMLGGDGNDVLNGTDGNDTLDGGIGNDTILGLRGNDKMVGGEGDDVMTWNPGEGSDTMDGDGGNDTAVDNGGAGNEHFIVSAQGQRVTATRDNAAPFFLDIAGTETLDLNTNGGDDSVEVNGGLAALIKVDANLGDGNDTIEARNTAVDVIDGAGGTDTATVDANDQVANVETVDNGAAPGGGGAPAAKVAFKSKRLKVKGGKATLKITCPAGQSACNGKAAILIGKKVVGSIDIKMAGGQTKTYRIKLNRKTRIKLAKDADKKLNATVRIRSANAAGEKVTAKKALKLVG